MTYSDEKRGVTISTWRWLSEDGEPVLRDVAVFCQWSIRTREGRTGFIALPVETEGVTVLSAAAQVVEKLREWDEVEPDD